MRFFRFRVTFTLMKEATLPTLTTLEQFTVGDLVAFDFPYADGGSKTRICAIVAEDSEQGDVVVAYGTTNLRLNNNPEFAIVVFLKN